MNGEKPCGPVIKNQKFLGGGSRNLKVNMILIVKFLILAMHTWTNMTLSECMIIALAALTMILNIGCADCSLHLQMNIEHNPSRQLFQDYCVSRARMSPDGNGKEVAGLRPHR